MARKNKNPVKFIKRHPKSSAAVVLAGGAAVAIIALAGNDSSSSNGGQPTKEISPAAVEKLRKSGGSSGSGSQGGAVDKKGSTNTDTSNSANWTKSASGNITLYSPANGGNLKSGGTISGSAKVKTVQYRLVDNAAGVLAQGQLSVVNGKFAGSVYFQPASSQGSLDIFSYNQNGAEINSLTVNVKLQ